MKKKGQVCSKSTSSQQQLRTPRDLQSTDHLVDEHYETVETPPRIPNSARRSLDEPFSNTFDTIEESKNVQSMQKLASKREGNEYLESTQGGSIYDAQTATINSARVS